MKRMAVENINTPHLYDGKIPNSFGITGSMCFATEQGLGYLAKDFYDNGVIQKVYIQPHSSRKSHREWFREEDIVSRPSDLLACDSLLFFENPFDWKLIPRAREMGVKTALMVMYECTPYPLFYQPDVILSPSALDKQYYPDSIQVTVPVPKHIKWKLRTRAKVFVHNAGNGGLGGRNGTKDVLEAMKYVKSPIKLIVRSQVPLGRTTDPRVEIVEGTVPESELWASGDVFLFPEKFNGLSLPIQEAFASGMVVMCGDRFPMNTWLPTEPLIPVSGYKRERIAVEFDSAIISPKDIATSIDRIYNQDITNLSTAGRDFGRQNSWLRLKKHYTNLCATNR